MAYKIPKAEVLAEAIKAALKEQSTVVSQSRFAKLVNDQLKKADPEYTASEERIRRVALFRKLAKVDIQTREAEEKSRNVRCPVCGSKTRRIQNETVYGGKVTLGYKCRACGYIYDPVEGDPDSGIAPGTLFEDIPNTWSCPVCGVRKEDFEPVE